MEAFLLVSRHALQQCTCSPLCCLHKWLVSKKNTSQVSKPFLPPACPLQARMDSGTRTAVSQSSLQCHTSTSRKFCCWPLLSCATALPHPWQVRMNGGTNIAAALSHAGKVLKRDAGADVAKVIVLITDGRVDGYQVWGCQRTWKVWEVWRCIARGAGAYVAIVFLFITEAGECV